MIALPLFEQAFEKFKFKTNIEFENGNWDMIKNFVRTKIGMGFVSTVCIGENDKDLVCKKLNRFFPTMDYKIVMKKGKIQNESVQNFVKLLDKNFKF